MYAGRPNSSEHIAVDTTGISPRVVYFVPDVTGALKLKLRKDTAYVTLNVTAGQLYPADLESVDITNSAVSQAVTVFRYV